MALALSSMAFAERSDSFVSVKALSVCYNVSVFQAGEIDCPHDAIALNQVSNNDIRFSSVCHRDEANECSEFGKGEHYILKTEVFVRKSALGAQQ